MDTIFIISVAFITFATFNIIFRLFDLWTTEKKMVSQGQPPLSNFEYYHVIVPYLVGVFVIILSIVLRDSLYSAQSGFGIIITSFIYMLVYVIIGLAGSFILTIFQARKARQYQTQEDNNEVQWYLWATD